VEIITGFKKNYWVSDDGFCSIGAGRASNPLNGDGDGKIKCDTSLSFALFGDTRELEDTDKSYFYL
jgi:hypothetical protein